MVPQADWERNTQERGGKERFWGGLPRVWGAGGHGAAGGTEV